MHDNALNSFMGVRSYQTSRRPLNKAAVELTIEFGRVKWLYFCSQSASAAEQRGRARYADMAAFEKAMGKILGNETCRQHIAKHVPSIFMPGSGRDKLWRTL